MPLYVIAFLIGILGCCTLSTLPSLYWTILILPCLFLIWKYRFLRILSFIAMGFLWCLFHAQVKLSNSFPIELESKDIIVIGEVVDLPIQTEYGYKFHFSVTQTQYQNTVQKFTGKISLNIYGQLSHSPHPQQIWQLKVRLKRPHGLTNFEGFDYTAWLFQHGFKAVGYTRDISKSVLLKESTMSIDTLRYRLIESIKQLLDGHQTGIIIALAIGEKQYLTKEQKTIFQRTGTFHLAVVSGLHIGLLTTFVFHILKLLWRYIGNKVRIYEHQFIAFVSIVCALLYAMLAGFSLPTQRAFIMIATMLVMPLLSRKIALFNSLFLALFIILIIDPLSVMNIGFWLSFIAVFIIFYFLYTKTMNYHHSSNYVINSINTQIMITIGLLPITLNSFGYISLISLFANLIAIPIIGFTTIPLILIGTLFIAIYPPIASLFLHTAAYLIDILWLYLTALSNINWAVWHTVIPSLSMTLLAMIGVIILLLPRLFYSRWIGSICFLPLLFPVISRPNSGEMWFTLLDVGQGLSAVIETQYHTLVYDTGVRTENDFDMGESVVLPFIRHRNIHHIDTLLLSHGDNDHIGGAESILANLPVHSILTSIPERFMNDTIDWCVAGHTWCWDGVIFKVLHPSTHYMSQSDNNMSCVLQVSAGETRLLLTGDIEKQVEYELIQHYGNELYSNVLVVPHHGSGTSSTNQFIDRVKPDIALFAVGYNNPYHHPKSEIVQRYKERDITLLDSVHAGAVTIELSPSGISMSRLAKDERRRFWHSP